MANLPGVRPAIPHFSSGPCAKRPGWSPENLKDAPLGRSHRAKVGKAKLKLRARVIEDGQTAVDVQAAFVVTK